MKKKVSEAEEHHAFIADVIDPFDCVHFRLKDIGYSDLFYCEDCDSKVVKIKDNNRAEGYRYEPKH